MCRHGSAQSGCCRIGFRQSGCARPRPVARWDVGNPSGNRSCLGAEPGPAVDPAPLGHHHIRLLQAWRTHAGMAATSTCQKRSVTTCLGLPAQGIPIAPFDAGVNIALHLPMLRRRILVSARACAKIRVPCVGGTGHRAGACGPDRLERQPRANAEMPESRYPRTCSTRRNSSFCAD